jgi:hypothetical protein
MTVLNRMTDDPDGKTKVKGYMCAIDWQYEIGNARDGNRVYPSLEALKEAHPMYEECGVVEVEVRITLTVMEPDYGRIEKTSTAPPPGAHAHDAPTEGGS